MKERKRIDIRVRGHNMNMIGQGSDFTANGNGIPQFPGILLIFQFPYEIRMELDHPVEGGILAGRFDGLDKPGLIVLKQAAPVKKCRVPQNMREHHGGCLGWIQPQLADHLLAGLDFLILVQVAPVEPRSHVIAVGKLVHQRVRLIG